MGLNSMEVEGAALVNGMNFGLPFDQFNLQLSFDYCVVYAVVGVMLSEIIVR